MNMDVFQQRVVAGKLWRSRNGTGDCCSVNSRGHIVAKYFQMIQKEQCTNSFTVWCHDSPEGRKLRWVMKRDGESNHCQSSLHTHYRYRMFAAKHQLSIMN
jgi:hypothetical protein